MKINNIEKRLEGRGDGETARELIKYAEKDPLHNIELELTNSLVRKFEEAKENGFEGTIEEYIKTAPLEDLKSLLMSGGGSVDFSSMSPGQMKAIFISENGYSPKTPKELVRGVKMYLKNLDIDGLPFGTFGKKD